VEEAVGGPEGPVLEPVSYTGQGHPRPRRRFPGNSQPTGAESPRSACRDC
jgi:hypothetical protein